MVFSSFVFLLAFLLLVLLIYYVCPGKVRNLVLLIASLLFYAWGEPVVCEYKDIPSENTDGRIDMLNDCLASRQQHDLTTLRKLMYSYCVEEYVTREMFTIVK